MAICQDDLFGLFLHLLSFLFCFVVSYTYLALPGKMGLNYYICTGEDPLPYDYLGGKFPVTAIISLLTIVVYTAISFKLSFAKRGIEELLHSTTGVAAGGNVQPQSTGFLAKLAPHVSKYAWSTMDLKNLYVTLKLKKNVFLKKNCTFIL